MIAIIQKELNVFFNSVLGFFFIILFLLTTGLFLWIFPTENNLFINKESELSFLFEWAPILFMLLIPAISMKSIAEEKKTKTMELLLTKPIKYHDIVLGKYITGIILIIISLLPTIIYYYSIYYLGNPVGNIDFGKTFGSSIGLLFLGAAILAISIYSSSIAEQQIVAFLISVVLNIILMFGFEFFSQIIKNRSISFFLEKLGMNFHYYSLQRGVIDTRDIIYFISIIILFLYLTLTNIRKIN